MKTRKSYTPPPDPVYRAGKKKERATKAIRALESVQVDLLESIFDNAKLIGVAHGISELLPVLKGYRKSLDE
jgi:hypothetical protein